MVLGTNATLAFDSLADKVAELATIVEAFTEYQLEYNNVIATHDHISPFFGIPTTQSKQLLQSIFSTTFKFFNNTKMSIIKHLTNLSGFKSKYLRDSGKYFIQSDNNKTN